MLVDILGNFVIEYPPRWTSNISAGFCKTSTNVKRSNTMSFKLSKHDTISACDTPAEIEIVDPKTRVPTGEFISIIVKDSKEFREYTREKTNARLRRDAMAQKRGRDPEIRTVEAIE